MSAVVTQIMETYRFSHYANGKRKERETEREGERERERGRGNTLKIGQLFFSHFFLFRFVFYYLL